MKRPLLTCLLLAWLAVPGAGQTPAPSESTAEQRLADELLAAPSDPNRDALLAAGGFDADRLSEALIASFQRLNREGRREEAGLSARLSVQVAEGARDRTLLARALSHAGVQLFNRGDYEASIVPHERSLEVAVELGDPLLCARAHTNIALALGELGWYDRALDRYEEALALVTDANHREGMSIVLTNLGMIHDYRGDTMRALEAYQRSLELMRSGADFKTAELGIPLTNVANAFLNLGRYELALRYATEAQKAKEASNARWSMPGNLRIAGAAHQGLGDEAAARAMWEKALSLAREVGDRRTEAGILSNLAGLEARAGRISGAIALYQQVLRSAQERGSRRREAYARIAIAFWQRVLGKHQEAEGEARAALALARELDHPELLADAQTVLGRALLADGRRAEARESFLAAIAVVESWRDTLTAGEEDRGAFFAGKLDPYLALVDLLVSEGRADEALAFAERAKARVLVDVLRGGRADLTGAMTASEREQERALEARLVSLNVQIQRERGKPSPDPKRLGELRAGRQQARIEMDGWRVRLHAAHPEVRVQRGEAPPLALPDTAELLPDARTALLEYVVAEGSVHLFVVTREPPGAPAVRVFTLAVPSSRLEKRVDAFRKRLAARDLGVAREARALYDLLLRPARGVLAGRSRLVVIPDGPLWNLPFQALQSAPGRYLVEDHAVSMAPSLTALREMARRREVNSPTPGLLAFANPTLGSSGPHGGFPPLPEAERQAMALGRLYGQAMSRVYVGRAASEGRAKDELGRHRVLHFATHGVLDDRNPMYSRLLLAAPDGSGEDGQLEAREILRMKLDADLAVLSACETGRGRVAPGEGIVGLTWAFFVAGCPSTVVSQWRVDSASTTELMLAFHREWRAGAPKDEALRRAALRVLRRPRYRHPFFWAGFLVAGDARSLRPGL